VVTSLKISTLIFPRSSTASFYTTVTTPTTNLRRSQHLWSKPIWNSRTQPMTLILMLHAVHRPFQKEMLGWSVAVTYLTKSMTWSVMLTRHCLRRIEPSISLTLPRSPRCSNAWHQLWRWEHNQTLEVDQEIGHYERCWGCPLRW